MCLQTAKFKTVKSQLLQWRIFGHGFSSSAFLKRIFWYLFSQLLQMFAISFFYTDYWVSNVKICRIFFVVFFHMTFWNGNFDEAVSTIGPISGVTVNVSWNGISSNASLWFKFWSSYFHNCFKSLDDLVGWGWFGLCSQGILLTVCRVYVTNRWCWINKQTISWSKNKPLPKSQPIAGFGRC